MQEIMVPKERHAKLIFPLVLVFLMLSAAGFFMIVSNSTTRSKRLAMEEKPVEKTVAPKADTKDTKDKTTENGASEEFEELPASENTPEEIDNDALKELDGLMNYVDNTSISDDLSDLE